MMLLAAAAASMLLPDDVRSQPAKAVEDASGADASPGARLEARAGKLAELGREGWSRAAALYARAAGMRGPSDRRATEDLEIAGHLYFHAGQHEASVLAFAAAGRLLLALGDFAGAAAAFRGGAWVANQAGLGEQAQQLCEWAEILSRPQPQSAPGRRSFDAGLARRS
jgi:hypothetical protein